MNDVTFKGAGLLDLHRLGLDDDRRARGQDAGPRPKALFERFHELVTSDPSKAADNAAPELGKLAVFSGVCEFPVRVKCASLPWHTMKAALDGSGQAEHGVDACAKPRTLSRDVEVAAIPYGDQHHRSPRAPPSSSPRPSAAPTP